MMAAKSTTGVNMRQAKSIGGVQRPVSAVLPQSAAMNRQTMDSYHDGGREEMVRGGSLWVSWSFII